MQEQIVVTVAAVLAGGVLAQWLGWRLGVPAIVLLLAGGLIAGPVTGALDPDELFGDLLFPTVSLAVAVILFEGALGLGWRGVREAGRTVWLLLTVGAAVTLVAGTVAARFILDIDWDLAVLVASVLVVTGPTVIGPIIRAVGLRGRVASILEAEGTLIDPLGAIITVIVFQALFDANHGSGSIVGEVFATLGVGTALGLLGAGLLILAFSRYLVPDQLHNVSTLAMVLVVFAVSNALRNESGLVAVTVMGIALAAQRWVPVRHVLEFNETLRILFISGLFVLLGAGIDADTLRQLEWRNVGFLAVLVVVVRPVGVYLSTIGSNLSKRERVFLAVTAPRGIVAAAIASVFALELAELGVADSQVLVSATFTVIAGTVLLSGLASKPLARRLGLVSERGGAIVVLGANPVARSLASGLEQHGADVRLVDLDRRELAAARMTGLHARHGSVFADSTWSELDIQGAACFVAMTGNDELNALAARHAASVLGRKQVFQLPPGRPEHEAWWQLPIGTFARPLFSRDARFALLSGRIEENWKVTATNLTEQFGAADYRKRHPDSIPYFVVDGRGGVDLFTGDMTRKLRPGETIVALVPPEPPRSAAAPAEG